ncbi:MAG: hypothetical protein AAF629_03530 [Chloroflexota bacterium]
MFITLFAVACGLGPLQFGNAGGDEPVEVEPEVAQATEASESDEASSDDNEATESDSDAETESPTATPASEPEADSAQTTDAPADGVALASCNVDPLGLPQNLAIADMFASDWMKGDAAEDSITIVEYGDFQ